MSFAQPFFDLVFAFAITQLSTSTSAPNAARASSPSQRPRRDRQARLYLSAPADRRGHRADRGIGLVLLAILAWGSLWLPPVAVSIGATAVLLTVAIWETQSLRHARF
ncbi:MAG: hypothetical protein WDN24_06625 [Sphingomonas sp.]